MNLCMVLRRWAKRRHQQPGDEEGILFGLAWDTFSADPFGKAKFLECLESFVLSDQLRDMPVPVCQELVTLYQQSPDRHQALEACLTHLNVTSMDIHQVRLLFLSFSYIHTTQELDVMFFLQVMNVGWQFGLYDAVIYIYNNGMLDYITPAEELLNILANVQQQVSL